VRTAISDVLCVCVADVGVAFLCCRVLRRLLLLTARKWLYTVASNLPASRTNFRDTSHLHLSASFLQSSWGASLFPQLSVVPVKLRLLSFYLWLLVVISAATTHDWKVMALVVNWTEYNLLLKDSDIFRYHSMQLDQWTRQSILSSTQISLIQLSYACVRNTVIVA